MQDDAQPVGFIGLGRMGASIADNLLAAGKRVLVFDLNPAARAALVGKGAEEASSLADLAGRAGAIFTCLPGPTEFEAVVTGEGGLLPHLRPATLLIDMTTNSRTAILAAQAALAARGCHLVDAPMSGGAEGAKSRELVVWVGGEAANYTRALPLLEAVARYPMHVGPIGSGVTTKLAHNLLGMSLQRLQAEVFSVAVKAGLDPLAFWKALRYGSAGRQSPLFLLTRTFLVNEFDDASFALALAHKDVGLGLEMARELGVPTPMVEHTFEDLDAAMREGLGKKDATVFLLQQLGRAGVTIGADRDEVARAVDEARRAF